MSNIVYPFVQDNYGRKLHYALRLAEKPHEARTVFILHGQGFSSVPSSFCHSDWNVVCPLDNFGFNNGGTWFLGENGDFFVKDLMLKLIEQIKKETQSDRLYFWGSSMGGYGAILFGLLCGAEAVFANVPQIRLKNTEYTDNNHLIKNCLDVVLNQDFPYWTDLTCLLASVDKRKYPTFFITQTRFHPFNYLKEHIYYFINKCDELDVNYFLEIVPKTGHLMYKSVADSIAYFDSYQDDVRNWVEKRKFFADYKNKLIKIEKSNNDDNFFEITLYLESDDNVGSKDLLLSFTPQYFNEAKPANYGLVLSSASDIGLFKYIPTKVGRYEITFTIPFPLSDIVEFSIKDFYPKGKTQVYDLKYKTFKN